MLRTAADHLSGLARDLSLACQGASAELRTRIGDLPDRADELARTCLATADAVGEAADLGTAILRDVSSGLQAGRPPSDLRDHLTPLVTRVRQLQTELADKVAAAQSLRGAVSDVTRMLTTEAAEMSNRLKVIEKDRAAAQREYDDIASRVDTMRWVTMVFPPAALVDELISLIESGKLTHERLRKASSDLSAQRRRVVEVQQALARSEAITHGLDETLPVIQNLANALGVVAGSLAKDDAWLEIGQDVTKAKVFVSTLQKSLDWLGLQAA